MELAVKGAETFIRKNIAEGKRVGDAAAARGAAVSKIVSTLIARNADMGCDVVVVDRKIIKSN